MPTIRLLTPEDLPLYVALRREMLADSPWSFGASVETDRGCNVERMREYLSKEHHAIAAAMEDARMLAVAAIRRDESLKRRHIAAIWGVYVTPVQRRRTLGRAVVSKAIEVARTWPGVAAVHLTVSESAPNAQRLYESLGFVAWGHEPDALRAHGRSWGEIHMRLAL